MEKQQKNERQENTKETLYFRDGQFIFFGRWHQSQKSESVTILSEQNNVPAQGEYFMGNDGETYLLYEDPDCCSCHKFFKVEPIKWRILEEKDDTLLLLAEDVIDVQNFDSSWHYNKWVGCSIREWLNEEFFFRAFTEEERTMILTSRIDNGAESTGLGANPNACESTEDKVFLLSYREAFELYGLSEQDKTKRVTDFVRFASGTNCDGWWWLRSPDTCERYARAVNREGKGWHGNTACVRNIHVDPELDDIPEVGVVPALRICVHSKTSR